MNIKMFGQNITNEIVIANNKVKKLQYEYAKLYILQDNLFYSNLACRKKYSTHIFHNQYDNISSIIDLLFLTIWANKMPVDAQLVKQFADNYIDINNMSEDDMLFVIQICNKYDLDIENMLSDGDIDNYSFSKRYILAINNYETLAKLLMFNILNMLKYIHYFNAINDNNFVQAILDILKKYILSLNDDDINSLSNNSMLFQRLELIYDVCCNSVYAKEFENILILLVDKIIPLCTSQKLQLYKPFQDLYYLFHYKDNAKINNIFNIRCKYDEKINI